MILKDKVAIITGSSRGIGETTALYFAREGAKVVTNGRNFETCSRTAGRIRDNGGEAHAVEADVGSLSDRDKLVSETIEKFGRIDVLVNNAAVTGSVRALEITEDEWDAVQKVNIRGAFFLTQKVAKHMAENGGGAIVNVSSIYYTGSKGQIHYDCSKGALVSMTRSLAEELAMFNIRVNCVAPGYIDTDMPSIIPDKVIQKALSVTPIRRLGRTGEVASVIAFLASDLASYITAQTVHVNGGWYRN
ncbi:MAG: 3-oxoacyl-ACP reductase family protein [bacterium]